MLNEVMLWMLVPLGVILLGGIAVLFWTPKSRFTASLFYFAAGVLIAALSTEILPQAVGPNRIGAFAVGFVLGVLMMLAVRSLCPNHPSDGLPEIKPDLSRKIQLETIVNIAVSLLVNGMLVGFAFGLSDASGMLLVITLTIKVMLIGCGLTQAMLSSGSRPLVPLTMLVVFGAVAYGGSILGVVIIENDWSMLTALLCALGAAVVLWIVFEELMIEARSRGARRTDSLLFFVGCGAAVVLSMVLNHQTTLA